jgi:hypothetical protein
MRVIGIRTRHRDVADHLLEPRGRDSAVDSYDFITRLSASASMADMWLCLGEKLMPLEGKRSLVNQPVILPVQDRRAVNLFPRLLPSRGRALSSAMRRALSWDDNSDKSVFFVEGKLADRRDLKANSPRSFQIRSRSREAGRFLASRVSEMPPRSQ